ncbi:MAG: hypothetical protein HYY06_07640 [Deltaproteobacteria bacterium]|nr:hypothetical protein [Deltaproteobacteria bacterium]
MVRLAICLTATWLAATSCATPPATPREPHARAAPAPAAGVKAVSETKRAPPPLEVPQQSTASPEDAACAEVQIGLDLRALPTGTSDSGMRMFVLGEADDLSSNAPAGPRPTIRVTPGTTVFAAAFGGTDDADAVSRCERTVTAYLPTAPRLPILMAPAARVITACRPCPGPP